MSKTHTTLALLAGATLAVIPAAAASAQAPADVTTLTALGTGSVAVVRPDRPSNATIRKAVRAARVAVGPVAVAGARREAERLAAVLGLELGALQSVAEQSSFPFGPFFGVNGTFGVDRYCGTIRRRVVRTTREGRRVPTGRIISRYRCRTPPSVSMSVSVTYLATPVT